MKTHICPRPPYCPKCANSISRPTYYGSLPAEGRLAMRLKKYGLTVAQYDIMLQCQNGVCKICKHPHNSERRGGLFVDHCHATGRIRGLLCCKCNSALGHFEDDIVRIQAALDYLKAQ